MISPLPWRRRQGGRTIPKAMNAEARRLGMTGSNLTNANGLHSAQNYTTARDLAVLTRRSAHGVSRNMRPYFGIEAIKYDDSWSATTISCSAGLPGRTG